MDTQDDIQHIATPQEPATDSIGATQEPPADVHKTDNLDVTAPQEPAADLAGVTQEPPTDVHKKNDLDVAAL